MEINEVIVVEGKSDTVKIKEAVNADTIETNGSAINQETIEMIRHAERKRGVIIFTDPDYPGERIRRIIDEQVPNCKHAFLPKHLAMNKKGIGIEHASVEDIIEALKNIPSLRKKEDSNAIDWQPILLKYRLLGGPKASFYRKKLGEKLHIGFTNGKQLMNRLTLFQIDQETFEKAMNDIVKEEDDD